MDPDRDSPAVVLHRNGIVRVQGHGDFVREAVGGFVHGVIQYLP
ncbi:hypothetical protein SDC9_160643 [bioreactor metagenome]|uniref:Uncharacterized protein n=1 Tax=bioreactor metagenome TaxID=1076179 RepID=A0A645FIG7_9ZZZZ